LGEKKEAVLHAMEAIVEPISLYEPVFNDNGDALYLMDQLSDSTGGDEIWLENIMLREAIKPAVPRNIEIDYERHSIYFEVTSEDMSIALGRRGQNAKLTSKLLGWRLQIDKVSKPSSKIDDKREAAVREFTKVGVPADMAARLVDAGFSGLSLFDEAGIEDDLQDAGFSADEAKFIVMTVAASR
jgi:N utilization substance protein A